MAGNVIRVVMEIPVYKGFSGPWRTQLLVPVWTTC